MISFLIFTALSSIMLVSSRALISLPFNVGMELWHRFSLEELTQFRSLGPAYDVFFSSPEFTVEYVKRRYPDLANSVPAIARYIMNAYDPFMTKMIWKTMVDSSRQLQCASLLYIAAKYQRWELFLWTRQHCKLSHEQIFAGFGTAFVNRPQNLVFQDRGTLDERSFLAWRRLMIDEGVINVDENIFFRTRALFLLQFRAFSRNSDALDQLTKTFDARNKDHWRKAVYLLTCGASIDAKESISSAVITGQHKLVEYYLVLGANPDLMRQNGLSPIHEAVQLRDLAMVELLLKFGTNPDIYSQNGYNPLIMALEEENESLFRLLLRYGANPNVMDLRSGLNAVSIAIDKRNATFLKLLIRYHADLNGKFDGLTTLQRAYRAQQEHIIRILVNEGANINPIDCRDNIIFQAVRDGNLTVVEYLVRHGSKMEIRDPFGNSLIQIAAQQESINSLNMMILFMADVNFASLDGTTALHVAAKKGYVAHTKLLLEANADVNKCDKESLTPLFYAAMNGHVEIVKLLVSKQADPNVQAKRLESRWFRNGYTPLHAAASKDHTEIIDVLVGAGANITMFDDRGRTPLCISSLRRKKKAYERLSDWQPTDNLK